MQLEKPSSFIIFHTGDFLMNIFVSRVGQWCVCVCECVRSPRGCLTIERGRHGDRGANFSSEAQPTHKSLWQGLEMKDTG